MIIVHENREILTHNSRRFLVVCNFPAESYTFTASVDVPPRLLKRRKSGGHEAESAPRPDVSRERNLVGLHDKYTFNDVRASLAAPAARSHRVVHRSVSDAPRMSESRAPVLPRSLAPPQATCWTLASQPPPPSWPASGCWPTRRRGARGWTPLVSRASAAALMEDAGSQ